MISDAQKVTVVANTLAWELYGNDGREVIINDQGVRQTEATQEETDFVLAIATKIVEALNACRG